MKQSCLLAIAAALLVSHSNAFQTGSQQRPSFLISSSQQHHDSSTTKLEMAKVSPSLENTVGIVGRGYVATLAAKLAALRGYDTWMLCPQGQEPTITQLMDTTTPDGTQLPPNLQLVTAADEEKIASCLAKTSAIICSVDDIEGLFNEGALKYVCNPTSSPNLKRVVGMSRNLNGKGMGFLVAASRRAANSEVWDNGNTKEYQSYEALLKEVAADCGAEYTIVRAGTLKGGACGDPGSENGEAYFPQYLSTKFYEMTKKDIVTWQLLFDCKVRGVSLAKGDVMVGPGGKAILTASSPEECKGDSSRAAVAEAMVRSLDMDCAGNVDFGVSTKEGRCPPTEEEWDELFQVLA
uniref:NAD(P)-binding domain-containing protein n=1 Tax=Ditylum brightwellii TaxID=49249 RepID=A0A6V2A3Q4_9STRA|mmetsp:Transcript_37413/g.54751  ORF Transcript_37413/g.54751 Transcript_37413/m.54751 type:complete len:351 (-) Transcript_37413:180-1232(-)